MITEKLLKALVMDQLHFFIVRLSDKRKVLEELRKIEDMQNPVYRAKSEIMSLTDKVGQMAKKREQLYKGWKEIGIEDLGEDLEFGDDVEYEQCEMCGQEKIRYVHILQHSDFNGELRVGCVCAEHMTDDYINPQKSERELKNRLNRKKNFMRREWQERAQGKYVLRYKGENITIMKSKFGAGWGVLYGGQSVFRYNNRRIDDFHTARLIAFDLFDEQYESRGEVQPYWDGMRWLYY